MATVRLTAYGASAKGAGYANESTACSTHTGGVQLLATDDSAVFAFATDGDPGHKVYLAKIASPSDASGLYGSSDGYASGQTIYVTEQNLGSIFGDINSEGYYEIEIDAHFGNSAYFTVMEEDTQVAQPSACPISYAFGTDTGESTIIDPEGCAECKDSGPVVSRFAKINTNYAKKDDTPDFKSVGQVPFSLQTAGPFSLKYRNAYKVTTGDKADE